MKISVIIITILVAQVSATFFDVFNGAVLSVQNTFGKLLRDVVTDVRDTVDCTILAVEHVLSLSPDATRRYYDKCGSVTNKTDSISDPQQDKTLPIVEVPLNLPNNEVYPQKVKPAEIDAKINETLSKDLGNHTAHNNVLSIENVMAKESEPLAGVNALVKKEMEKLSNEVTADIKNIEKQTDSESSVDTILQEIKVLEKREQNTTNTSEAYEIHGLMDQLLGKLYAIEVAEAAENTKLEEILKHLKNDSNDSYVGLRHQFEEWKEEESRHLSEIKNKIEDHEKISDDLGLNSNHGSNDTQPVISKTDLKRDGVESTLDSQELSDINTTQVKDILNCSTSPTTINDSNVQSLSVGNGTLSFLNTTLKESGLNDTMITSSSSNTTETPFGSDILHPFENPTTFGSSELLTISTNLSITTQSNFTGDNTNESMENTKYSITDGGSLNEPVENKDESTCVTTNKPTSILSTNEDNSTEINIHNNPLPVKETSLGVTSQPMSIEFNTDSRMDADLATNNTVIINAAKAETELNSTAQDSVFIDNSNDSAITSIFNTMLENTRVNTTESENIETSTLTTSEPATTLVPFKDIESNDTVITRTPCSKDVSMEYSTVTTKTGGDNDSNTSSLIIENTPVNETIRPEKTTTTGKEESLIDIMKIVDDNESNDTITSSALPIIESTTVGSTTIEDGFFASGTTLEDEETAKILINEDYSNVTMLSSDSSPIVETTQVSETVEPEEITTASSNEDSSNDSDTMIKSTFLPIPESTPSRETSHAEAITSFESLIETTIELLNHSSNGNVNDSSDYIINTTPTPLIGQYESEIIQDTTTDSTSEDESLSSAENNSTETPNTEDDTDITSLTTSESISKENITAVKNAEPLSMTTNSPIVSTTTLIDTDSDTDTMTSTLFPTSKNTTVTEITEPVESLTPTENEDSTILSTDLPATIPDEDDDDDDSNDEVTNITLSNADNEAITETVDSIETVTVFKEQNLSSTSSSVPYETVITSTASTPTESTPLTETITSTESPTASRNEEELPITITDTFSSSTPKMQTKQLLINPEDPFKIPIYGQAVMPPITSGVCNQQTKVETGAPIQAAFDAFDSIYERLLHSELPFGPEEDILKMSNIPSTTSVTIAPKLNFGYTYVPTPTRQPYSFDTTSAITDKSTPGVLTTHLPTITAGRANNYETPPVDLNSFFHTPEKDTETHQPALKEARQLIANSKRSARINEKQKKCKKYT